MNEGLDMKTISVRLEDAIYEELDEMLEEMGQTKQTFYETFTKACLRERRIPFIISVPYVPEKEKGDKMAAFKRLEASRKKYPDALDLEKERKEVMDEKYGIVD